MDRAQTDPTRDLPLRDVPTPSPYRSSLPWRVFNGASTLLDRRFGWDKLPLPVSLAVLVGLRNDLRRSNLHDSNRLPTDPLAPLPAPPGDVSIRTLDGSYNDLDDPRAGMAGTRFGRNIPLSAVDPDPEATLLEPSPREVSRRLLTRTEFLPATTVNVLVASWLQFMIRDWFSHGHGDADRPIAVPLAADDEWQQNPMLIPRTVADPTRPDPTSGPPTFVNELTHWWDLSSIYGTSEDEARARRTGNEGHLFLGADGVIPLPDDPSADPTREPGFWLGMGMLVSLFALEHNAICDKLAEAYPDLDDDELYQRARLVNAAVVAKIHTVEWTPAVIAHPATKIAMRANWFGIAGERLHRLLGRLSSSEVISGIPGSKTQGYGVPFSLTEEFAARLPDAPPDPRRRTGSSSPPRGETVLDCEFADLAGPAARAVFAEHTLPDLFYSFGTEYAGAIVLRNFPRALQNFTRPNDSNPMDLGAIDIIRTREAGVPRYNEFRRLLRLRPMKSFADLTDDATLVADLSDLYEGDVEKLDLTIGMFAERRPTGFAFSDTAFRIFILMASRRLNSDRFFAADYSDETYTKVGVQWIQDATMAGALLRHWPELAARLPEQANAFQPWPDTEPTDTAS